MIPYFKGRKAVERSVESLRTLMDFYYVVPSEDVLSQFYTEKEKNFHNQEVVLNYLLTKKFFEEFKEEEIMNLIIPKMKLSKYQKNEVVFMKQNTIRIVITGDIIMKSHKIRIYPSKLMVNFKEGDIMGSCEGNDICYDSDNWCITRCETSCATFTNKEFQPIWDIYVKQKKNAGLKMISISLLNHKSTTSTLIPLVKILKPITYLSSKTLCKIIPYLELRKYKTNSLIQPQSKKSLINKDYIEFYKLYNMKLKTEALKAKR
ncbi:unnamed protein product [Moneuplotes crassus]|uniref:Uncharacterized protein n=1 Tax=Euplotes crassus TaxID=5936 RepID=A0AAD1UGX1_EUPCR|nr:unnamed protein product [Moneuplotes crassus]